MKRSLAFLAGLTLVLAFPVGSQAGVSGTKHDLSSAGAGAKTNVGRVCVFCHTPHQPSGTSTDPLWNHTLSTTATYGVYASDTLNATPSELGSGTAVSNLCLSCHDGTVSVISMYNAPNEVATITLTTGGNVGTDGKITGNPNIGTDLTNDHPVNFTYDAALSTADGGLNDPTTTAVSDLLFGGSVQCASCHDPHNNTYTPFLAKDNAASALCTTCHNK